MGGGTSIWVSPEARSDPREIFNGRLAFLATTLAMAGCAYGFDQGNIGGVLTLPTFKHAFGLDKLSEGAADEREGNIASLSKLIFAVVFREMLRTNPRQWPLVVQPVLCCPPHVPISWVANGR